MIYVGETERTLGIRFKEHHANVRLKSEHSVGPHFNSVGHNILDMRVMALWQCHDLAVDRKDLETFFIQKLGTRFPNGLNRKL